MIGVSDRRWNSPTTPPRVKLPPGCGGLPAQVQARSLPPRRRDPSNGHGPARPPPIGGDARATAASIGTGGRTGRQYARSPSAPVPVRPGPWPMRVVGGVNEAGVRCLTATHSSLGPAIPCDDRMVLRLLLALRPTLVHPDGESLDARHDQRPALVSRASGGEQRGRRIKRDG